MTTIGHSVEEVAWYALPAHDTARRLGVEPEVGLDTEQVQRRGAEYGPNALPEEPPPSVWAVIRGQLSNPMNIMLLIVGGVSLAIVQSSPGATGPRCNGPATKRQAPSSALPVPQSRTSAGWLWVWRCAPTPASVMTSRLLVTPPKQHSSCWPPRWASTLRTRVELCPAALRFRLTPSTSSWRLSTTARSGSLAAYCGSPTS